MDGPLDDGTAWLDARISPRASPGLGMASGSGAEIDWTDSEGERTVIDTLATGMLRMYTQPSVLHPSCHLTCVHQLAMVHSVLRSSFVYNFWLICVQFSAHLCIIFFQLICVQFLVWSVQIFLIVDSPHGRPPRSAAKRQTMPQPHAAWSWVLRPSTPPHAPPPTLARHRARIGTSRIPRDLRPNV